MVQSSATTVTEYLKELPPERRKEIQAVRKVVKANLPPGYKETMGYGMITYVIPLSRYPDTYNKQPLSVVALAAQKQHHSLYLMAVYADKQTEQWFTKAFKASGKKLDMGKSCVRFKKAEDLPLDVIGQAVARVPVDDYIAAYEAARAK